MNSPLEETIVGDLFRTSLIGTGFVSAVCARTIVGHTKAQTTASIIALFIVSILVHNLDARWSSVIRVPSKGTSNYPSKQTLPSPLAMERSNSSILSAAPFIPLKTAPLAATVASRSHRQHGQSGISPLCASGRQCHVSECLDERAFQLAAHVAQDLVGGMPGHRRPIGPRLDQGGEDVRDRQQSHQIGNLR
jgi:hypothetical protein